MGMGPTIPYPYPLHPMGTKFSHLYIHGYYFVPYPHSYWVFTRRVHGSWVPIAIPSLNSRFFSPGACVSDAAPTNAILAPPRTFLCSRSMANQLTRSSPSAKLVHGRGARNSISSFQSFGARPGISPVPVAGDDEENIFFVSLPAARVRGSFSSKGRKTKQISIRSPPTFFC
jgi:hypothetical protein